MTASQEDSPQYLLGRGWLQSVRLNAQHYVSVKSHGWLLHPQVNDFTTAHKDESSFRVADLACGTGIVAFEIHDRFPNIQVTALDQSSAQFPPSWTVPSKVTMGQMDLLKPVPGQYVGTFDVIHLRFIFNVIFQGGKEIMLANLRTMLKPGGWLQWTDAYYPFFSEVDRETRQLTGIPLAWSTVGNLFAQANEQTWMRDGHKLVAENGFVEAEKTEPPWNPSTAQEQTAVAMTTAAEVTSALQPVLPPDQAEDIKTKFHEMEEKVKTGTQYGYHLVTIIAKKPTA